MLVAVATPHQIRDKSDFRIIASDESGLLVEFTPLHLPPTVEKINGVDYQLYDFGQSMLEEKPRPGSPYLPTRSLLVRFPSLDGNSVELVNLEYEDIPQVRLSPLPDLQDGQSGPVLRKMIDPTAYTLQKFVPEELVSIEGIGETRGSILGEVRIRPLQYNPGASILRKYKRVVVRVGFGKGSLNQRHPEPALRGLAINDYYAGTDGSSNKTSARKALRNSVLATGIWYQFPVSEDGVYKITGQMLLDAGVPASANPRTVRIHGSGGFEPPLNPNAPAPDDLAENPVFVSDQMNAGQLDPQDYVLFYGRASRGWKYNIPTKVFYHHVNRFSDVNLYYLTYGNGPSRRMSEIASTNLPGAFRPDRVQGKVFREDERINLLSSGLDWLGQTFNNGDQQVFVHQLPGIDFSRPIRYRFHIGARSPSFSTFAIFEHDSPLSPPISLVSTQIGSYYDRQLKDAYVERTIVPAFIEDQSRLRFAYSSPSATGNGYLDWFEVFYNRYLHAHGDVFGFNAPDTLALAEYAVGGFSGGPVVVLDVTNPDSVLLVTGATVSSDSCLFQVQLLPGTSREFALAGPTGMKAIGPMRRVVNQNLHGDSTESDYIIISHPDFVAAANRLRAHRERPGDEFLKSTVVTSDQVYHEFGNGFPSPAAIRNYLRYLYSNWSKPPKYVLLFGDGTFDYKGILAQGTNFIPAWETEESYDPIDSYSTDDDFATFVNGGRVTMGVGRLTARTVAEAHTMVDKIIEYETGGTRDPWKVRVTFVADDALAGIASGGQVENDRDLHVRHAESVASKVPPLFELRKIYLFDYPTTYSAGGRRKPGVNEAIRNQINEGTVILNYSGHGNPRLWTHEAVFVRESDFPFLHNKGRYFFLIAATCNYSQFDALTDVSGGELLVAQANAGAIATLSATRVVYAFQNLQLNDTFVSQLFQMDSLGRVMPQRLGDVMYRTKQIWSRDNDKKYFLLGDPALLLAFPKRYAAVDSINHMPASQAGQLRALGEASFAGSVRESDGSLDSAFTGQAQVVVYDANRKVHIDDPNGVQFDYTVGGNILFKGEQSVVGGKVTAKFVVPKDISYDNDFGRMTLYLSNSTTDGVGYTTNFRVGGTDSSAAVDESGPILKLFIDDRQSFHPGDIVSSSPKLIVDLFDSNGINTSGAGIGHRLEAWLDGNTESIDLSNYYRSKTDTYREGTIEYSFGELSPGMHRVRLRAWDTHNNASVDETVFNVGTGSGLQLSRVFNYPNPFSDYTVFTFEHDQVGGIDVEIKIYTVAGRLIQSIAQRNLANRFVQIPWDGRDREGDILANGTYLYKVIARAQSGRFTAESLGKLSVLK